MDSSIVTNQEEVNPETHKSKYFHFLLERSTSNRIEALSEVHLRNILYEYASYMGLNKHYLKPAIARIAELAYEGNAVNMGDFWLVPCEEVFRFNARGEAESLGKWSLGDWLEATAIERANEASGVGFVLTLNESIFDEGDE